MLGLTDNIHLDQLDMRLLHLLMEDSKIPYAELARQLNLSRAAVTKRVNALVEKGVIERFTVYINPRKIRLDITILFELITTPNHVKEIMDEAIENANRKTIGHFFDIIFGRRYDEEDMIVLKENDFM